MILRLEIDNVADVGCPSALCFLCISEARSGGADRFALSGQSITVKGAHAELFDKQRLAVLILPEPVIERRQGGGQTTGVRRRELGAGSLSHWERVRVRAYGDRT